MEYTDWQRAQEIFHQVVELQADLRPAALVDLCRHDPALMAHVEAMLAEDACEDPLLNDGVAPLAASLLEHHWTANGRLAFPRLGHYRVERVLGEGGMGVVYLAHHEQIGGEVAIKLLRDAWLSPSRRQRFTAEQRMLAQMRHPGIAQIYEADTTPDGTPWFAMEYVQGETLTSYWNTQRGTVQQCLMLFREICVAVQYAHQRAIIHRDLKPSNILVTSGGQVKLLDFGIAKSLDDSSQSDSTVTALRLMTPAYAAPEQLHGDAVGVFTDIYALGVLLYEMLTGELPTEWPARGIPTEPRRPSAVADLNRFATPPSAGEWSDFNALCLTAIREKPEQRYASVEAMIRDIDAFLDKRPLAARTPSWSYRLRKFVSRRRAPLAYATATALLIACLVFYFTNRLRVARDAALNEAARTERMQGFTRNLFRGNESTVGPAEDMRVKTLLDRGREEANSLSGDPEMQADMRETLGDIYRKLGDTDKADALMSDALGFRRTQDSPRKYAHALVQLGLVRMDEGHLDDAEKMEQEAYDIASRLRKEAGRSVGSVEAEAMVALGSTLEAKGDYARASELLSQALKLQPADQTPDPDSAAVLRELANTHFYQGHYTVADSLNHQVLTMHRALYGERHPEIAEDLNNLAAIQFELGNLEQAEKQYRQSLAITEAWYGVAHPKTADDLTSLGRTLVREKKFSDAQSVLERALRIQQTIHGHDHLTVASALNELGTLASLREIYDEAEQRFSEALAIWRKIYGSEHQFIGVGLSNLGSVYMGKKDYVKAEAMYRQALAVFIETVHESHLNTAIAHVKLGRALLRQHRYLEAEAETRKGYETLAGTVAPANGFLKAAKLDLVQIYTGLHRESEADRFRE